MIKSSELNNKNQQISINNHNINTLNNLINFNKKFNEKKNFQLLIDDNEDYIGYKTFKYYTQKIISSRINNKVYYGKSINTEEDLLLRQKTNLL